MSKSSNELYEFLNLRLDVSQRTLLRSGKPLPLADKVFDTLRVLVQQNGRLVSKDDLMREVWPDTVVEENNLDQKISLLRQALGDSAKGKKKIVETVRGHGYRFVPEVRMVDAPRPVGLRKNLSEAERPVATASAFTSTVSRVDFGHPSERQANLSTALKPLAEREPQKDEAGQRPSLSLVRPAKPETSFADLFRNNFRYISAAALLIAVGVGAVIYLSQTRAAATSGRISSLAVLPFKPVVTADRDEAFELGTADALITQLGGSQELAVRPLSAVRNYSLSDADAAAIGRDLKTDAVLDGNYQRDGDRIRLTLRLVQSGDNAVIWTGKIDEKATDGFVLQDAISARVTQALMPRLANGPQFALTNRGTTDQEAFQLYQRGRHFWNLRTEAGYRKAIESFEQAIARDANYAQAYAGLADGYQFLGDTHYQAREPVSNISRARAAAKRALELNDQLAEPHATLGLIALNIDWDLAGAEREYRRAIELDPNYVSAHHWLGETVLAGTGRFDEGVAEMRKAQELDPLSSIINADLGKTLYYARRYDEAEKQLRYTFELDPSFSQAHSWLSFVYIAEGRIPEAIAEQIAASGGQTSDLQTAYIAALKGQKAEANTALATFESVSDRRTLNESNQMLIMLSIAAGDNDKAFASLEREFKMRGTALTSLKVAPFYDPLRHDPRFADLIRRVGI